MAVHWALIGVNATLEITQKQKHGGATWGHPLRVETNTLQLLLRCTTKPSSSRRRRRRPIPPQACCQKDAAISVGARNTSRATSRDAGTAVTDP